MSVGRRLSRIAGVDPMHGPEQGGSSLNGALRALKHPRQVISPPLNTEADDRTAVSPSSRAFETASRPQYLI